MSEIINQGDIANERRKVTAIGNSWIVCKSRSHRGYVYYFNTLTGEAVWNLSSAEIEKAKFRTQALEKQLGIEATKCPEPKDFPPNIPHNGTDHTTVSAQFSVNTDLREQTMNSRNLNITNRNSEAPNQLSEVLQRLNNNDATVNSIHALHNLNTINNLIQTFNIQHSTPTYNPKVWDVPQTQQIMLPPTITPLLNQTQTPMNIAFNNVSPAASGIFSHCFENTSYNSVAKDTGNFYPRNHNNHKRWQNIKANNLDLRQRISFQNRSFNAKSDKPGGFDKMRSNSRGGFNNTYSNNDGNHSRNGGSMEKSSVEPLLQEKSSKLDLSPLKKLASSDCNPDIWYIVVDMDVLLNEFKFLNTLSDSDQRCHLMVPKRVILELKDYVIRSESIQARRILRFLTQQIETGISFMAEDPKNIESDNMANVIHETSLELMNRNYHVIILSNNKQLLDYRSFSTVNIFSIPDVKKLLNPCTEKNVMTVSKKPFDNDEFLNKIKIIVPNTSDSSTIVNDSQLNDYNNSIAQPKTKKHSQLDDHNNITTQPKSKHSNTSDIKEQTLKCTVDAGIQTDFEEITNVTTNTLGDENICKIIANTKTTEDFPKKNTDTPVLHVSDSKKAIKLKRNTSYQSSVVTKQSNEKKRFRWRRRRNFTRVSEQSDNSITESNTNLDKNTDEKNTETIFVSDLNKDKEIVNVKETSNSSVSNSERIIDGNSFSNNSTNNQEFQSENIDSKPMFEIDSTSMEEYLKMKCDEWVSRFIQIMEEVLTQLLHQDPPFSNKTMPPPWTMHEATLCIAKKYSYSKEIKEAANKLSNILFKISDAKGKISITMLPSQYMEMYSFGVHLLAAIKVVVNNSEDIQIAEDSLKKLLEDIRNPNLDNSTNDNFNDLSTNNISDVSDICDDSTLLRKISPSVPRTTGIALNTRSRKRKLNEESIEPVKFIRNIDIKSTFFSTLKLQSVPKNDTVMPQVQMQQEEHDNDLHIQEDRSFSSKNAKVTSIVEPKIVRNFSLCAEFEEKLKKKSVINEYDDDELDYEEDEDYSEYISEGAPDENVNNTNEILQGEDSESIGSQKSVDPVLYDETSNEKFKYIVAMLIKEIRAALCQIKMLCDKCYEELTRPHPSSTKKRELNTMAEEAQINLIRLCRSLESMLDNEDNHPDQNILNLLKKADVNIKNVDKKLLLEYKMTVTNCKTYAEGFLNSIQQILSDFSSSV